MEDLGLPRWVGAEAFKDPSRQNTRKGSVGAGSRYESDDDSDDEEKVIKMPSEAPALPSQRIERINPIVR